MCKLTVCCDASLCRDDHNILHGGIGIAFCEDGRVVQDISEHRCVDKDSSTDLEYFAVRRALQEIAKRQTEQNTTVVIYNDNEQAVARWQTFVTVPPAQQPRVLKALAAKSLTVVFCRVPRKEVRRAHWLAKCAAISHFSTHRAQNTRRQLAELLKH